MFYGIRMATLGVRGLRLACDCELAHVVEPDGPRALNKSRSRTGHVTTQRRRPRVVDSSSCHRQRPQSCNVSYTCKI